MMMLGVPLLSLSLLAASAQLPPHPRLIITQERLKELLFLINSNETRATFYYQQVLAFGEQVSVHFSSDIAGYPEAWYAGSATATNF